MTEVLIVSKTRMYPGCCVGGLTLNNKVSVRLLTQYGHNQSENTLFEIGQVWDLNIIRESNVKPPHTEDVRVFKQELLEPNPISNILEYLMKNIPNVTPLEPNYLFDGLMQADNNKFFISEENVPDYSTDFWRTSKKLERYIRERQGKENQVRYRFPDYSFDAPYVGVAPSIEEIPANTLVRISLPRWWRADHFSGQRCYLQISGWYF